MSGLLARSSIGQDTGLSSRGERFNSATGYSWSGGVTGAWRSDTSPWLVQFRPGLLMSGEQSRRKRYDSALPVETDTSDSTLGPWRNGSVSAF